MGFKILLHIQILKNYSIWKMTKDLTEIFKPGYQTSLLSSRNVFCARNHRIKRNISNKVMQRKF